MMLASSQISCSIGSAASLGEDISSEGAYGSNSTLAYQAAARKAVSNVNSSADGPSTAPQARL